MRWYTIRNAPMDGSRVILGFVGRKDVIPARWNKKGKQGPGWYHSNNKVQDQPTHFQPFPEPPTEWDY